MCPHPCPPLQLYPCRLSLILLPLQQLFQAAVLVDCVRRFLSIYGTPWHIRFKAYLAFIAAFAAKAAGAALLAAYAFWWIRSHSLWTLQLPEGMSSLNQVYGMVFLAGSTILAMVYIKWCGAAVEVGSQPPGARCLASGMEAWRSAAAGLSSRWHRGAVAGMGRRMGAPSQPPACPSRCAHTADDQPAGERGAEQEQGGGGRGGGRQGDQGTKWQPQKRATAPMSSGDRTTHSVPAVTPHLPEHTTPDNIFLPMWNETESTPSTSAS